MRRTDTATRFRFGVQAPILGNQRGNRPTRWNFRAAVFAVMALGAGMIADPAEPARAASYPSWQDVQNAKANVDTAAAKVSQIESLIGQLNADVEATEKEAVRRGAALQVAQQEFDEADARASSLGIQVADAKAAEDAANAQVGRVVAQLYRKGSTDITMSLMLSGSGHAGSTERDMLLSHLGRLTKLTEGSSRVYDRAKAAQNTVRSLESQAVVVARERAKLEVEAKDSLAAAIETATLLEAKVAQQNEDMLVMKAQLASLKDSSATTVAAYQAGVEAEREQAAARPPAGGGSSGSVSSQGWAVPASGRITDGFGPRASPCSGCSSYHLGIDIGASCSAGIYSASAGTVVYAGPQGSYGNFVLVDHGSSVSTGYAHMVSGGVLVKIGQRVAAGQAIGRVGSTGASTGCHLHYEVRISGSQIDGVPFMRQRGAPLG